ncbi:MAG: hypothetical protein ACYCX2_10880 [Christensenellales bacterium]
MKDQKKPQTVEKGKSFAVTALLITSIGITVLGASFSVYSVLNKVTFTVMNSQIGGVVFGLVITFLGLRYCLSVLKLKDEVYKSTSKFSWSNFKKEKAHKSF